MASLCTYSTDKHVNLGFWMVWGWSPIKVNLFMSSFYREGCISMSPFARKCLNTLMEGKHPVFTRFQCCPVAALAQTVNKNEMRRKYRNAICATRTMARAVSRSRRISRQYFWKMCLAFLTSVLRLEWNCSGNVYVFHPMQLSKGTYRRPKTSNCNMHNAHKCTDFGLISLNSDWPSNELESNPHCTYLPALLCATCSSSKALNKMR